MSAKRGSTSKGDSDVDIIDKKQSACTNKSRECRHRDRAEDVDEDGQSSDADDISSQSSSDDDTDGSDDSTSSTSCSYLLCDHEVVSKDSMRRVGEAISRLLVVCYLNVTREFYEDTVQDLQDCWLRDKSLQLLKYLTIDFKTFTRGGTFQMSVEEEIEKAIAKELPERVLRYCIETCYDTLCWLAEDLGRDIETYGPPCACSFASCISHFEYQTRLASNLASEIKPSRPIDVKSISASIQQIVNSKSSSLNKFSADLLLSRLFEAWQGMTDALWKKANQINPLKVKEMQEGFRWLRGLDGVDLWHAIVLQEYGAHLDEYKRDMEKSDKKDGEKVQESDKNDGIKDQEKKDTSIRAKLEESLQTLRSEKETVMKTDSKKQGDHAAEEEVSTDPTKGFIRRALAHLFRKKGISAFAEGHNVIASLHLAQAMVYDDEVTDPAILAKCDEEARLLAKSDRKCCKVLRFNGMGSAAYQARAVHRAGNGDLKQAEEDFRNALVLERDDPVRFEVLKRQCIETLLGATIAWEPSCIGRHGQWEAPKMQGHCGTCNDEDILGPDRHRAETTIPKEKGMTSESSLSVGDVFSQVSFAIAFTRIVKRHTGVDVTVPILGTDDT